MTNQVDLPDVIGLCERLIQIDSINPFQAAQDDAGQWHIEGNEAEILGECEALLAQAGFRTWRQDCGGGRENLLAEKGEGPALLMYAHVDTVEVKAGWSSEQALTPRYGTLDVDGREQEVLYGLGANDMKGGVAVLLRAACLAQPQGYKLKVALGCDEEFWSLGSFKLVHESDFLDDVFGVLVPEVGESTMDPTPGKVLVTLGRCGRTELEVRVPGTGGHGTEPDRPDRVNAISQAAQIALAVEAYSQRLPDIKPFEDSPETIRPSALVTSIRGGEGHLSVPDQATLLVNRVLAPSETPASAAKDLEALITAMQQEGTLRKVEQGGQEVAPQVTTRARPTPPLRPYLQSPQQPFLRHVLDVIGAQTPYQLGMGVSVADENRFAAEANKPVVVLGPRGENAHAADEWVTLESLRQLETLYRAILASIPTYLEHAAR